MTAEDVKKLAKEYFDSNPGETKVFATSDGCLFPKQVHRDLHVQKGQHTPIDFLKSDFEEKKDSKKDK